MKFNLKIIFLAVAYNKCNASIWSQVGSDLNGENASDYFGFSVSMSSDGNKVAIGARSGYIRVYEYSADSWNQLGIDIDGKQDLDWTGYSVSLSADGTKVAYGAPQYNGNNGEKSGVV